MRAWLAGLCAISLLGCGSADPHTPAADAAITVEPDARPEACVDDTDPRTVDFYGDACSSMPFPVNTECRPDFTGWCIDNVCRPMCKTTCPRCPGGEAKLAAAGACYCVPRT